jgi:hypothetical protein
LLLLHLFASVCIINTYIYSSDLGGNELAANRSGGAAQLRDRRMMARIEESVESAPSRQPEIISEEERRQLQHDWFQTTRTKFGGAHLKVARRPPPLLVDKTNKHSFEHAAPPGRVTFAGDAQRVSGGQGVCGPQICTSVQEWTSAKM